MVMVMVVVVVGGDDGGGGGGGIGDAGGAVLARDSCKWHHCEEAVHSTEHGISRDQIRSDSMHILGLCAYLCQYMCFVRV